MSDSAETCDTSVLVPALLPWHAHHAAARGVVRSGLSGIPAHVVVETYSVLTRLPAPHRLAPRDAAALLARMPGRLLALPPDRYAPTLTALAANGIRGGATYDGLVAATAAEHDLRLVTLDRRALSSYQAVGAAVRIL